VTECPITHEACQHEQCMWWADADRYCALLYAVLLAGGFNQHVEDSQESG
jgi:hypothetical protein